MPGLACVDLFCGAGGLTKGLTSEGIPVVAGIDIDPACRHPFETNNSASFIESDISRADPRTFTGLFGDADVRILAGCAPCQPFSSYSQRYEGSNPQRVAITEMEK
jgi:DNA (cytosine-5)-methyltransferase 1